MRLPVSQQAVRQRGSAQNRSWLRAAWAPRGNEFSNGDRGRTPRVSGIPDGRGSAMRVAARYDIHGNLPALEAVLDEVRRASVDLLVVGGDLASAADRIRATAYPKAQEFAARSVLDPPSEDQMLAAYARAELA
jgi:hypothetical protein